VPERGSVSVTSDVWAVLRASKDFARLQERRIVEVAYTNGYVRLRGTCFVGQARCDGVQINFTEKVPGALASLLGFASRDSFQIAKASSASSGIGSLIALLVDEFLVMVRTYTTSGRQFVFSPVSAKGSLIGGKIDMVKSMRLRAQGFGHVLAFTKSTASYATPVNQLVLAALVEIERLARFVNLGDGALALSRSLCMLYDDCRDASFLSRDRAYLTSQAIRVGDSHPTSLIRDMLSLASILLAHESFEHDRTAGRVIPWTWFINLERLFESAVRIVLKRVTGAQLGRGSAAPQPIFDVITSSYRANPDLIVRSPGLGVAIGDVKYKTYEGAKAAASDVYQLLVHAAAFRAAKAFLVFPGDTFQCRRMGKDAHGIETFFFVVRTNFLDIDLKQVAITLGLPVTSPGATSLPYGALPVVAAETLPVS
jgi:5-methylcytosine-specific restriction endonuclease McrBC regulatory subunit McrC